MGKPQKVIIETHKDYVERKADEVLWLLIILPAFFGVMFGLISFVLFKNYFISVIALIIGILLYIRIYKWIFPSKKKKEFKKKSSKNWERIDRLPNWAYRKMKKKKKNLVYGDTYMYLKKNNKFFKKKK